MKKIVMAIFWIIMLTSMIAGCGRSDDENTDGIQHAENVETNESSNNDMLGEMKENEESSAGEISEKEQAKRYYTYLNEVVLQEKHNTDIPQELVPLEPLSVSVNKKGYDMYGWDIFTKGHTGLLSAFLEDFDHDGSLEMLGVSLKYLYTYNTIYKDVFFEPGTSLDDKSSEYYCMVLNCTLYDIDDTDEIVASSYEYALMPTDSWGKILVGIEKVDEEYYLFGYSISENMSTYGPSHFVVGNLTSRTNGGSIQWQYSSELNAGRANAGNYNEILHIYSPITINDTTLSTLKLGLEPDLGNRLVAMVDFDYVEFGGDELVMTPMDNTDLRRHLESGGETWERIELPQGGKIEVAENGDAESRFHEIIEEINLATGTTFNQENVNEENGKFSCSYVSDMGNRVRLTWDVADGGLCGISVEGQNDDAEWTAAKDVLLGLPELGFSSEEIALFAGEVKQIQDWLTYQNGIEIGEWRVVRFVTIYYTFSASKLTP